MCSTLAVAEEELPQLSFVAFILSSTVVSTLDSTGENGDKLQILPLRNIVYLLLFFDSLYCCTFFPKAYSYSLETISWMLLWPNSFNLAVLGS